MNGISHAKLIRACNAALEQLASDIVQGRTVTPDIAALRNLLCEALADGEGKAEFIVRACNNHEQLLAALAELVRLKDLKESDPAEYERCATMKAAAWKAARAAVARAQGAREILGGEQ